MDGELGNGRDERRMQPPPIRDREAPERHGYSE